MNIKDSFNDYVRVHPAEADTFRLLSEQLTRPADIASRQNFVGHVTTSGFVINESTRQVLLLEHKSLRKMLQPGGHIEPEDSSLLEAVLREIEGETGILRHDLCLRPVTPQNPEIPFDIDTHFIPENKSKAEPGHYHHDFRYVYTTRTNEVAINPGESTGYEWVNWNDFIGMPQFAGIADKIQAILEPNTRNFFRALAHRDSQKISVIAVSHIIPSSEEYITSLHENFNLIGIIPKPKSINKHTQQLLETKGVTLLNQFTRESIAADPDKLVELLRPHDKICFIDIGGYFADVGGHLRQKLGKKFCGIVEDTENGHQRYEKALTGKYKIMSVARSPLKNYEDQLVGHSIAHATETVLRQVNTLAAYRQCGVIGYGKVGRGIVEYLQRQGIKPRVSEIQALRSIQAACDGAILTSTEELLRCSDIIFCATGSRALDILSFRDLKRGAFLASATSSDDELDLSYVDSEYEREEIHENITRFVKQGHMFHLINNGNAVNFLFSAAVDHYINLVQGELIFSVCKLAIGAQRDRSAKEIIVNKPSEHEHIARLWLDYVMRTF